jgi:hypothetical protein
MSEVVDYMDAYRTLPEASFHGSGQWRVDIHKLGGGTLGRQYSGKWIVNVYKWGDLHESKIIEAEGNHLEVAVSHFNEYLDD